MKDVIDTVEWLGKSEEERRNILQWVTFPQWPVSGARAILRHHESLSLMLLVLPTCCW